MKNRSNKSLIIVITIAVIALGFIFFIARKPAPKANKPHFNFKGKIAIVIDDWGYNFHTASITDGINYRFTASILPNLRYSKALAEKFHSRGFEIILHLPMQPKENYYLEKDTITTSMDQVTIRGIINKDLESVIYAKGANDHMGSSATENKHTVTLVFKELKNKHLFFLDSFVNPNSVCMEVSREIGIPFAKRDVFLDNKIEEKYIMQQLDKLKSIARKKGWAIGIAHDRKVTLEVLRKEMPNLVKDGYKLVFVSELVK